MFHCQDQFHYLDLHWFWQEIHGFEIVVPCSNVCFSSAFKILSFSLIVFLWLTCNLLCIYYALEPMTFWICKSMTFTKFGKFLTIVFSNSFSVPFSFLWFWGFKCLYIRNFDTTRYFMLYSFMGSIFFFCVLQIRLFNLYFFC